MSPEKVGLAYGVFRGKSDSFIVCDASSNTVTLAVLQEKIIGAIDAPIFAPGLMQGPLDIEAIRDVDSGKMTANQAFNCGGILSKMGRSSLEQCLPEEESLAIESLSLFAAMEINALIALCRDWGEANPDLFLAGSPAARLSQRVSELLGLEVQPLDSCAAAQGCAWIAEDVFNGSKNILGLEDGPISQFQGWCGMEKVNWNDLLAELEAEVTAPLVQEKMQAQNMLEKVAAALYLMEEASADIAMIDRLDMMQILLTEAVKDNVCTNTKCPHYSKKCKMSSVSTPESEITAYPAGILSFLLICCLAFSSRS